ncbi:MAG: hypothetical protein FWD84_02860 [Oscillospiraceae bacterium]|nr:hypothetical protein [Oscillospiraceae bacterium]
MKIPNEKAKRLEEALQECLAQIEQLEERYGLACRMNRTIAQRISEILDSIGAFVIVSLE